MKNRAMLIGGIDAGKTSLTDALLDREYKPNKIKTQALIYDDWIVDTPGEYTENPMYYRNLMATSMEITHVLFLQDATRNKSIFAPGFSSGINKLPIGIVTKTDHEDANIEQAIDFLKQAMVQGPIVIASAYAGEGLEEIKDLIRLGSINDFRSYVEASESENILFHEG
jgi:ethanolamine utilization protein EutP